MFMPLLGNVNRKDDSYWTWERERERGIVFCIRCFKARIDARVTIIQAPFTCVPPPFFVLNSATLVVIHNAQLFSDCKPFDDSNYTHTSTRWQIDNGGRPQGEREREKTSYFLGWGDCVNISRRISRPLSEKRKNYCAVGSLLLVY